MTIQKPAIPSRRDRLQVPAERKAEARAGMGGEQVKSGDTLAPTPVSEPTAQPVPVTQAESFPTPPEPAPALMTEVASIAATTASPVAPVTPRRRGRKPAEPDASLIEPERSTKIPESVWSEIRLILAQLPRGEQFPTNIKAYLVAAHRLYEAQLRKQGKIPPK